MGVAGEVDGFDGLAQREAMGNEAGEVEGAIAVAGEDEVDGFVLDGDRRAVAAHEGFFVHADLAGVEGGLFVLGLGEEADAAAGTDAVHGDGDEGVGADCEKGYVGSAACRRGFAGGGDVVLCVQQVGEAVGCGDGVALGVEV